MKRFRHWLQGPQPPRMSDAQYRKHFGDGMMDLGADGIRVSIEAVETEFKSDMFYWDNGDPYTRSIEYPDSFNENEAEKRK